MERICKNCKYCSIRGRCELITLSRFGSKKKEFAKVDVNTKCNLGMSFINDDGTEFFYGEEFEPKSRLIKQEAILPIPIEDWEV